MREDTVTEAVLPSLFWRIDEAEQVRSMADTSLQIYRDDVLRNLKWLLNASCHPDKSNIHHYPAVVDSVLNYGLTPNTGRLGSSIDIHDFVTQIRDAILRFEPRILRETLKVEAFAEELDGFSFNISGSIWCEPLPESFSFQTTVEAETGNWVFTKV